MTVWSKESPATLTRPACGAPPPWRRPQTTVNVPTDQVIYVRGGAAGAHQCMPREIGDGLPLGTDTAPAPAVKTYTDDINMTLTTQYCGQGNAYIEGTLKGRVTMATSNSITVTGDLVLANGLDGTDMLGLVAAQLG